MKVLWDDENKGEMLYYNEIMIRMIGSDLC
jgi:hypothetical protein